MAQNIILCHILKTKLGIKIGQNVKDDFHSVLRISSAHNKGGPPDINIAQILHLSNLFELKRTVYQKSVRYSVSISYFTNIAVQNVNKVRACEQEWTSSLRVSLTSSFRPLLFVLVWANPLLVLFLPFSNEKVPGMAKC